MDELKQELYKHSASIQIENNITLLQRKAWNALLWNAYDELPTKEVHSIPVQELSKLIGYDSHDTEYLKEAAKAMMRCVVEYNVLGKDGKSKKWGALVLLAQVDIEDGMFNYAYPPELRQRLHNPEMYARLNLGLQKRFDSKHALALWELCTDYLGSGREHGETPFLELTTFRKLMGIAKEEYPRFKDLSLYVIKKPVEEINHVSDFRVTVEYQYQGRKVIALKFKIRRVALLPEPAQIKMFPDLEDMPVVIKELKDVGLSSNDAWEIWQQSFSYVDASVRPADPGEGAERAFLQYVREKIHLLKRRQASGKVDNSTGFLLKALRLNWSNPEFEIEVKKEAKREEAQAARDKEIRRKTLEAQREEREKARDNELQDACMSLVENEPDLLKEAAAWAMREVQGFMMLYDRGKSEAENYRDRHAVKALLNPYLRQQCPDYFHAIEKRHDPGISVIEAQLQTL